MAGEHLLCFSMPALKFAIGMDFSMIFRSLDQVWDNNPDAVILLVTGFLLFVLLVLDASGRNAHLRD